MKFKWYPVAIVALCLGIVVLLLGRFDFEIAIEPNSPTASPTLDTFETPPELSPTPTPRPTVSPSPSYPPVTPTPGGLRVSNQTQSPVRVALLYQQDGEKNYSKPAHWDFAPGEGSSQGLILSLPNRDLRLREGDILVAFAQDGSRQYWGPFVVGETNEPILEPQTQEWQLILQP